MRLLTNDELIKEFYRKVQDEDSELSFEQVKAVVSNEFKYLKKEIASGELPTIRLKYFGTFLVYDARVIELKERMEEQFRKGNITVKLYDQRKKMIDDFLEKQD